MNEEPENHETTAALNKEQVQLMAFQLISSAGDAFDHYYQSVETAEKGEYDAAQALIKEGDEALSVAHNAQTKLLVAETKNEEVPYSVLMVHAQDHLSMAIFTGRMAKLLIELWKKVNTNEK